MTIARLVIVSPTFGLSMYRPFLLMIAILLLGTSSASASLMTLSESGAEEIWEAADTFRSLVQVSDHDNLPSKCKFLGLLVVVATTSSSSDNIENEFAVGNDCEPSTRLNRVSTNETEIRSILRQSPCWRILRPPKV